MAVFVFGTPRKEFAFESKLTAVASAYFAVTLLVAGVRTANCQQEKPSSEPRPLRGNRNELGFHHGPPGKAGAGNKEARPMACLAKGESQSGWLACASAATGIRFWTSARGREISFLGSGGDADRGDSAS